MVRMSVNLTNIAVCNYDHVNAYEVDGLELKQIHFIVTPEHITTFKT